MDGLLPCIRKQYPRLEKLGKKQDSRRSKWIFQCVLAFASGSHLNLHSQRSRESFAVLLTHNRRVIRVEDGRPKSASTNSVKNESFGSLNDTKVTIIYGFERVVPQLTGAAEEGVSNAKPGTVVGSVLSFLLYFCNPGQGRSPLSKYGIKINFTLDVRMEGSK